MKDYNQRCDTQLDEWVKGNSIHNVVDDECCPDFSCCGLKIQPKKVREQFKIYHDIGNKELEIKMLMGFLGDLISEEFPDKNIHIVK